MLKSALSEAQIIVFKKQSGGPGLFAYVALGLIGQVRANAFDE
jgi:hypothetical protein